MNKIIFYILHNPRQLGDSLLRHCAYWLPDKTYLSLLFKCWFGREMNWKNPNLYQEKLQWLKLYDHKALYTRMVDKIEAKKYAASIIGEKYIIPTLGVWNTFDEIDFDNLPDKFVLKTNQSGGNQGIVICQDKSTFDKKKARKKLEVALKKSIYRDYREWPYKDVIPKIFAEAFMTDDSAFNQGGLSDYKFTCFNGVADNVMVCVDRHLQDTKFYFFNQAWELLPLNTRGKQTNPSFKLPKPGCIDEMFELAAKLSKGIPFLRVDLYCINGQPYFGETTFYPDSGFDPNILYETEVLFGQKIILPAQ